MQDCKCEWECEDGDGKKKKKKSFPQRRVPIFHSVSVNYDRWDSLLHTFFFPSKHRFNEQFCNLGHATAQFLLIIRYRFSSEMSTHRSESAELHSPKMFLSCCTSRFQRKAWKRPAESAVQPKPPNESNAPQTGDKHFGELCYKWNTISGGAVKGSHSAERSILLRKRVDNQGNGSPSQIWLTCISRHSQFPTMTPTALQDNMQWNASAVKW